MTPRTPGNGKKEEACQTPRTEVWAGGGNGSPEQKQSPGFDVDAVLELSKLTLDPWEKEIISGEMKMLVEFAGQLPQFSSDAVQSLEHMAPANNTVRADLPKTCPDRTALLQNAPEKQDGFLFVPQTVEEE